VTTAGASAGRIGHGGRIVNGLVLVILRPRVCASGRIVQAAERSLARAHGRIGTEGQQS
jgi:hypothetical protein